MTETEIAASTSHKIVTGCGNLYVHVTLDDDDNIHRVFCNMGKAGGCPAAMLEALARTCHIGINHGASLAEIAEGLRGIQCPQKRPGFGDQQEVLSCADALGRILQRYADDEIDAPKQEGVSGAQQCPECGAPTAMIEGCQTCKSCGWSKCS